MLCFLSHLLLVLVNFVSLNERVFSAACYVVSARRCCLVDSLVKQMVLAKCNSQTMLL